MNIIELIEKFNWQTIIAMLAIGWYFTKEIRESLKILDKDVREQSTRTDKLYEMFCELQKQMKDEIIALKKEQYDSLKEKK